MTIIVWVIPSVILILLLMIMARRIALRFLRVPHSVVLVLAVVTATVLLLAATWAIAPARLISDLGAAVVIAGFLVGVPLLALEFRNP